RGGMGRVYLAHQTTLGDRRVALKLIRPDDATEPGMRERFLRETRLAAGLQAHPGIAAVYDAGSEGNVLYYAMRFVPGRPLDKVLEGLRRRAGLSVRDDRPSRSAPCRTILDPRPGLEGAEVFQNDAYVVTCARLMMQVAEALAVAHAVEPAIVHRDLKPANIILEAIPVSAPDSGDSDEAPRTQVCSRPVVIDFGLARPQGTRGLTLPLDRLETPEYVAPEVHEDPTAATPRSDVFSLGATLFDMLALEDPQTRPRAYLGLPLLRLKNPRVDASLAAIVKRATEKEPRLRYRDAAQLADDLRRYLNREPVHARPVSIFGCLRVWVHRKPAAAAAGLFGLMVLVIVGRLAFSWIADWQALARAKGERESDLVQAEELDGQARFVEAAKIIRKWEAPDKLERLGPSEDFTDLRNRYSSEPRWTLVKDLPEADWEDDDGKPLSLSSESTRVILDALRPYLTPAANARGDHDVYLRLVKGLLSRGEDELVQEVAREVTEWIGNTKDLAILGAPWIEYVAPSRLLPVMIWRGSRGGYQLVAEGCLQHLEHLEQRTRKPERLSPPSAHAVVVLLGHLPTAAAYDALLAQCDANNPETTRLALTGLGRIALWWLTLHHVLDPDQMPKSVNQNILKGGLDRMLDPGLGQRLDPLEEGSLCHEVLAHVLALESTMNETERSELRKKLRAALAGPRQIPSLPVVLAAAGAERSEIENLVSTQLTDQAPSRLVILAEALVLHGTREATGRLEQLCNDPLRQIEGMGLPWTLPEPPSDRVARVDLLRDSISQGIRWAFDALRGTGRRPAELPSEPLARALEALLENAEKRQARLHLLAEIFAAWCGPAGKNRLLAEADRILTVEPGSERLTQHPAWALVEAARGHEGLELKISFWLEQLSDTWNDTASAAACHGKFLLQQDQPQQALVWLKRVAEAGSAGDPFLLAALWRRSAMPSWESPEMQRVFAARLRALRDSSRPSESEATGELTFKAPSEPGPRSEGGTGTLRAVWGFSEDGVAFEGCALGCLAPGPELAHRHHSRSHRFVALVQPGRSRFVLYAQVPERYSQKTSLVLEHCAASNPDQPYGGYSVVTVLVNAARLNSITVLGHDHQSDTVTVGPLLQPGRNEIVIRFDGGPSEYWLARVTLEEDD
ncbi:MAG: serine/threonine-protein kinase, partial [Planctomycetota bacterium]